MSTNGIINNKITLGSYKETFKAINEITKQVCENKGFLERLFLTKPLLTHHLFKYIRVNTQSIKFKLFATNFESWSPFSNFFSGLILGFACFFDKEITFELDSNKFNEHLQNIKNKEYNNILNRAYTKLKEDKKEVESEEQRFFDECNALFNSEEQKLNQAHKIIEDIVNEQDKYTKNVLVSCFDATYCSLTQNHKLHLAYKINRYKESEKNKDTKVVLTACLEKTYLYLTKEQKNLFNNFAFS